tara:strand:- start:1309 stop:1533 length:225 start_codon:yes stop_codon:yes gene_type:complete
MSKPTAAQRRILESLKAGPRLCSQVEGSGMAKAAFDLLHHGWARLDDDPTVKDPPGSTIPALSYHLTDAGRDHL